ncbi:MAG: amidase, partial [Planctomycetota bacterium]|nr:amidase [Planctomycetota bacterium]
LAELVREGQTRSPAKRQMAVDFQKQVVAQMNDSLGSGEIGLSPAAAGPAPRGLTSTGNPVMNSIWTLLGYPAVTLPMPGTRSLPLGLQLTATQRDDRRLLRVAERLATDLAID